MYRYSHQRHWSLHTLYRLSRVHFYVFIRCPARALCQGLPRGDLFYQLTTLASLTPFTMGLGFLFVFKTNFSWSSSIYCNQQSYHVLFLVMREWLWPPFVPTTHCTLSYCRFFISDAPAARTLVISLLAFLKNLTIVITLTDAPLLLKSSHALLRYCCSMLNNPFSRLEFCYIYW